MHWLLQIARGKKLSMRYSRRMQLHQLIFDNSRKCKNCLDNIQPLYLSANDLDEVIAVAASNCGKTKLSLLQYLDMIKSNDPNHKKRKAYQHGPKKDW